MRRDFRRILRGLSPFLLVFALLTSPPGAFARGTPPDDERHDASSVEEVVVTGAMRVTQGGAQDINFFRGEVSENRIPKPGDITAEGLLSEHDILLPARQPCAQLFCLTGEAAPADLLADPNAKYLVGVGFASNIDEKTWHREPLNLVAVVDKSGSMMGTPLELVRMSLIEVLKQLGPEDQLSIVLYGDTSHVFLEPTRVTGRARNAIQRSIDSIASMGSTSMEAGLRLGYSVARNSAAEFEGTTRVMLFTDERPNVGATDAGSFMAMAIDASHERIGLTTVGVGVQFGADLATRISSVRGGNLYFIRNSEDVMSLYSGHLDYMVSELAHDLRVVIRPHTGYKISGVYGVPGEMLGWQGQDSVTFTIPTAFLSDKGGGIFFTLAKASEVAFLPGVAVNPQESLASAEVTYVPAGEAAAGSHSIDIAPPAAQMSAGMQVGRMLVDEFTSLHAAVTAHYIENDQEKAYQLMRGLVSRLDAVKDENFDAERELVASLHDQLTFLSGHGSEHDLRSSYGLLWGKWEVVRVRGDADYSRNDVLQFTPENDFRVIYGRPRDGVDSEDEMYEFNYDQVLLSDSEAVFNYRVSKNNLVLRRVNTGEAVYLKRVL